MTLKLSPRYLLAFILLLLVMMEMHEIVHISVGWMICGCWGPRDFNVWDLCDACENSETLGWIATMAGPFFSFALMWLGMFWLSSNNSKKVALGFSLIFSNIPFGRITTVMMGGGDEMVVVRHFMTGDFSRTQMIFIGTLIVLAIGVPPIAKAFRILQNKRAWIYIVGFLTLPLLFLLVYTLIGLNTLLESGFLASPWIMGTPLFITLHTSIALVLLMAFRRHLYTINGI